MAERKRRGVTKEHRDNLTKAVREAIDSKKWNTITLGAVADVDQSQISRVYHGQGGLNPYAANQVAIALGIDPATFGVQLSKSNNVHPVDSLAFALAVHRLGKVVSEEAIRRAADELANGKRLTCDAWTNRIVEIEHAVRAEPTAAKPAEPAARSRKR